MGFEALGPTCVRRFAQSERVLGESAKREAVLDPTLGASREMRNILFAGCIAATVSPAALADVTIGSVLELEHDGTLGVARSGHFFFDTTAAPDAPRYGGTSWSFGQAGTNVFSYCNPFRPGQITGFCVEVNEGFGQGVCMKYDVVKYGDVPGTGPFGTIGSNIQRMNFVGDLYGRHYDNVMSMSGGFQDFVDKVAGFQLALWEITHENHNANGVTAKEELSLFKGAFQIEEGTFSAEAVDYAEQFMSSIGDGGLLTVSNLLGLRNNGNPGYQDILIVVPSPAVAGLAGLGLIGLRRRRR